MGASPTNAMFLVQGASDKLTIGSEVGAKSSNDSVDLDGSGAAEVKKLVDELHGILKDLPVEDPKGSQDIYGHDIGIQFALGMPGEPGSFEWANGGSAGCDGHSNVQPTDEQKKQFERAVGLAAQLAALSDDAKSLLADGHSLMKP
jgi:hypothetical protein